MDEKVINSPSSALGLSAVSLLSLSTTSGTRGEEQDEHNGYHLIMIILSAQCCSQGEGPQERLLRLGTLSVS